MGARSIWQSTDPYSGDTTVHTTIKTGCISSLLHILQCFWYTAYNEIVEEILLFSQAHACCASLCFFYTTTITLAVPPSSPYNPNETLDPSCGPRDTNCYIAASSVTTWGSISGSLTDQSDLQTVLNAKQPTISAGTTSQYYRGDKTFQTLDTSIVPENGNLYYTQARFNTAFSGKTTDSLAQGTINKYSQWKPKAGSAIGTTYITAIPSSLNYSGNVSITEGSLRIDRGDDYGSRFFTVDPVSTQIILGDIDQAFSGSYIKVDSAENEIEFHANTFLLGHNGIARIFSQVNEGYSVLTLQAMDVEGNIGGDLKVDLDSSAGFLVSKNNSYLFNVLSNGSVIMSSLAGTGSRMVVANASGVLSTQDIPSSPWTTSGSNISFNDGNVGIGATSPLSKLNILFGNGSLSNDIRTRGIVSEYYGVGAHAGKGGIAMVAGGTKSAPTSVSVGDIASLSQPLFYDGTVWRVGGRIDTYVASVTASTNVVTGLSFYTGTATGDATLGSFTGMTEKMRLDNSGNLGIDTITPSSNLHVKGVGGLSSFVLTDDGTNAYRQTFTTETNNRLEWKWGIESDDDKFMALSIVSGKNQINTTNRDFVFRSTSLANIMTIDDLGNVGIGTTTPTFPLDVAGSVSSTQTYGYLSSAGVTGTANGTNSYSIRASARMLATEFNAVSDARLKDVQFDLDSALALDLISKLKPLSFRWKTNPTGQPILGFLAQDVESVIPNAVSSIATENFPDQRELSYNQLTAVAIGAIKELHIRVSILPDFEEPSLGEKVSEFLREVANGIVRGKKLCAEDVCVDKAELQNMIDYIHRQQNKQESSPTVSPPPPIVLDAPSSEISVPTLTPPNPVPEAPVEPVSPLIVVPVE